MRGKTRRSWLGGIAPLLMLVLVCVVSGCGVSSTPAMKQNAASIVDIAKVIRDEGADKYSLEAKVLFALAEVNEGILGLPEIRLLLRSDPDLRKEDLKAMEENSVQAKKDHEDGGLWTGAAADAVTVAGWGLSAIGLLSVGRWLMAQAPKIRKWKKKGDKIGDRVASAATTATDAVRNVLPDDVPGGDST